VQVNWSIRHQLLLDNCCGCRSCGGSAWQTANKHNQRCRLSRSLEIAALKHGNLMAHFWAATQDKQNKEMQATPRSSKQIPKAPFCKAVMWVVFILKLQAPANTTN
jgi:hypothetical protein